MLERIKLIYATMMSDYLDLREPYPLALSIGMGRTEFKNDNRFSKEEIDEAHEFIKEHKMKPNIESIKLAIDCLQEGINKYLTLAHVYPEDSDAKEVWPQSADKLKEVVEWIKKETL